MKFFLVRPRECRLAQDEQILPPGLRSAPKSEYHVGRRAAPPLNVSLQTFGAAARGLGGGAEQRGALL
jgi:hypothetical protein